MRPLRRALILGVMLTASTATARAQDPSPQEPAMPRSDARTELATFAGGCFWCMEPPFEQLPGVTSVTAGYTGGQEAHPTYEQVSSGSTGHCEAVQVAYDPSKVTYQQLLDAFWRNVDPTTENRQFADAGKQYRTAIFYHTPEQQRLAEASKRALGASGKFRQPIVTAIEPAGPFYPAEDDHQGYSKKNPLRYTLYKIGSGRESFIKRTWGSGADAGAGPDAPAPSAEPPKAAPPKGQP